MHPGRGAEQYNGCHAGALGAERYDSSRARRQRRSGTRRRSGRAWGSGRSRSSGCSRSEVDILTYSPLTAISKAAEGLSDSAVPFFPRYVDAVPGYPHGMEQHIDVESVREDVLIAIEYSHDQDDWVTPLTEALDGVSVEDAAWKPVIASDQVKTIWEIVLHMAVWTENMVVRMHGDPRAHPVEGAWPSMPKDRSDEAWEASKARLMDAVESLRREVKSADMSALAAPIEGGGNRLEDILCRTIHNAYHIGQITKLKQWREDLTSI